MSTEDFPPNRSQPPALPVHKPAERELASEAPVAVLEAVFASGSTGKSLLHNLLLQYGHTAFFPIS